MDDIDSKALEEHRKTVAHEQSLGLRNIWTTVVGPLLSKLAALEDENKALRESLDNIKARVCGDAYPHWDKTEQTTRSRLWIADTCDAALSKPAALPANGKGETPPAPQPLEGAVKATRSPADWFSFLTSHADSEGNIPRDRFGKLARALSSLSPAPQPVGEVRATHRHKKRGSEYVLLGIGKMQAEDWFTLILGEGEDGRNAWVKDRVDGREVAIYRGVTDGQLWVRPREEFEDGRFEALSASPSSQDQEDGI